VDVALPPPLDLLPPLLRGIGVTVQLWLGAAAVALLAGGIAGLGRASSSRPLRWAATTYVEIFRGTSALVQLFWVYFALPLLGIDIPKMASGILVLGLNSGSYAAEVVRGAVQAVPRGQREAATALGFSRRQTLWRIVVPQAALAALPPAGNLLIELLKNTALASMVTIHDLTFLGQALRSETLRTVEIFSLILVLYFLLAQAGRFGISRLEARLALGRDSRSLASRIGPA
jgi:polar amino acid transport system permease protein